ncbi:MAG: T9SS type A sorting domain-containing protein [Calditrichaeota bacterium]|nr:T9SS type A sorting domain-containing protein [Calditrichota bacterium]
MSITSESGFFGIPGADSLNDVWFDDITNSTSFGYVHPVDIDVLKLSPADYRIVILDAIESMQVDTTDETEGLFHVLKMDQANGLSPGEVVYSGSSGDTAVHDATAMCQMKQGEYFNPETDRIAVTFWQGNKIGLFSFDKWTNRFTLEDTIEIAASSPIGIYYAFNQFFVVSEDSQAVYRLDANGTQLGRYGQWGLSSNGYQWISAIDCHLESGSTLHMYLCDGEYRRVDHLIAIASDSAIRRVSQDWARAIDSVEYYIHEVALLPSSKLLGFNRLERRFYLWDDINDLAGADRCNWMWPDTLSQPIHMWQSLGRLVLAYVPDTSGWTMKSFQVNSETFDNPISYPDTHWTVAMSPIYVTDKIVVGAGEFLTIDAGVEVLFDEGTCIRVDSGGVLTVNGSSNDSVQMHSMDVGEAWAGITIIGGTISMNYTALSDGDSACIFTYAPDSVSLSNSTFVGNRMLGNRGTVRLTGSPSIIQFVQSCDISGGAAEGVGLYAYNCSVKIGDVIVHDCSKINAQFMAVTGNIEGCTFADPTDKYGVMFASAGTTPNFQCCAFKNLRPATGTWKSTIYAALGTGPTFGYTGTSGGVSNVFEDSSDYILRMSGWTVLPIIQAESSGPGGRNDWYQRKASGKYISWGLPYPNPLTPYYAKEQFWDRIPADSSDFSPSDPAYFSLGSPPGQRWDLCGGAEASLSPETRAGIALDDVLPEQDSLFSVGMAAELNEDYQTAQEIFRTIASSAESNQLAWQAVSHVVSTQRRLDSEAGEAWIPALIDSLIEADQSAYSTWLYGNRLLASYRLAREEYSDAMALCTALLNSGLPEVDSILVSIDLLGIQMAAGFGDGGGSLDESDLSPLPLDLRCSSLSDAIDRQAHLLEVLSGLDSESGEDNQSPAIPTVYKLYQNFPNPFNPSTQIQFDLPEGARVLLRIFNTLGQEVATIKNVTYPAGHHIVTWNGKSNSGTDVATGLYIYQIQAGSFTSARKLVILR